MEEAEPLKQYSRDRVEELSVLLTDKIDEGLHKLRNRVNDLQTKGLTKEGFVGPNEEFKTLIDYCTANIPRLTKQSDLTDENLTE